VVALRSSEDRVELPIQVVSPFLLGGHVLAIAMFVCAKIFHPH